MKLYTKTGDSGMTSLLKGERVPKNHPIIQAVGALDELTSHLGKVKSMLADEDLVAQLILTQQKLISLMASVSDTDLVDSKVTQEDVSLLEALIDYYQDKCDAFTHFILPGDSVVSAEIHIARTVARRAERVLSECPQVTTHIKQYINRLADYLYIIAKYVDASVEQSNGIEKITTTEPTLNLLAANAIIEQVKKRAMQMGLNVVVSVVSKEGNPISVQSMDGAFLVSFDLCQTKAFTAAALQMTTEELGKLVAKGADFEGLEEMLNCKIVTLAGGCPIKVNGKLIGAVGVSGGSTAQDGALSEYGAKYFERG